MLTPTLNNPNQMREFSAVCGRGVEASSGPVVMIPPALDSLGFSQFQEPVIASTRSPTLDLVLNLR